MQEPNATPKAKAKGKAKVKGKAKAKGTAKAKASGMKRPARKADVEPQDVADATDVPEDAEDAENVDVGEAVDEAPRQRLPPVEEEVEMVDAKEAVMGAVEETTDVEEKPVDGEPKAVVEEQGAEEEPSDGKPLAINLETQSSEALTATEIEEPAAKRIKRMASSQIPASLVCLGFDLQHALGSKVVQHSSDGFRCCGATT